jgi:hypothetical protein
MFDHADDTADCVIFYCKKASSCAQLGQDNAVSMYVDMEAR